MAVRIKPKRTATTGNAPTTGDLEAGEIAINLADRIMYYRDTLNNIKTINIADLTDFDTGDLTEGANLYYTDARVRAAISGGTGVSIDGSGVISIGQSVGVTDNVTFNDVTVDGDLTVNGTTTTINTTELTIEDNIIELNNGYSGSSPTANAGFTVNRGGGTEPDAELRWNETLDRWEINDGTGYVEIASAGAVDLSTSSINELQDVTVTGTPADNEVLAWDTTGGDWINQTASEAGLATTSDIANSADWDTAYSWGDHSVAGYLTSYTETDPVFSASEAASITATDTGNWDTAFGWGDHSAAGYLTTETFTGTVTSVAQTVPTGFTVSGSPVTTSGTLAIGFDTGYSLPTTASQTNWDTAYGWGDHSVEGYITSADGGDAATLDGIDSTSFLRSDTSDTFSGGRLIVDVANFGESMIIQRPASGGTVVTMNNYQPTSYSDGDETGAFNFGIGDFGGTFNLTGGAKMEYDSGQQHIFKLISIENNASVVGIAQLDKLNARFFNGSTFTVADDSTDINISTTRSAINFNSQIETTSGLAVTSGGITGSAAGFGDVSSFGRDNGAGTALEVRGDHTSTLSDGDNSGAIGFQINDGSTYAFPGQIRSRYQSSGKNELVFEVYDNGVSSFNLHNVLSGTYDDILLLDDKLKARYQSNTTTIRPNVSGETVELASNDGTDFISVTDGDINVTLNNSELITFTDGAITVNDAAHMVVKSSDFGTVFKAVRVGSSASAANFAAELTTAKSAGGASNILYSTDHSDGSEYNGQINFGHDGAGNRNLTLTTFTGVATARNHMIMDEIGIYVAQDIHQSVNASGTTTASYNIDQGKNLHEYTLGANTTFAFTGSLADSATATMLTIKITQDGAGGAYTVTWPGSVKWPGGSTPTISTGNGAVDVVSMFTYDSGTTWYASIAQDFS